MKAKDWRFDRRMPSVDDVEAECNASKAFFDSSGYMECMRPHEQRLHCFSAGFHRGMSWAEQKGQWCCDHVWREVARKSLEGDSRYQTIWEWCGVCGALRESRPGPYIADPVLSTELPTHDRAKALKREAPSTDETTSKEERA